MSDETQKICTLDQTASDSSVVNVVKSVGKRGSKVPTLAFKVMGAVHVATFRLSRGRVGGSFRCLNILFLENVGARSGRRYTTPLLFGRDGDDLVLVASKGGSARHPGWYHNLVAHPNVSVQIAHHRVAVRARTACADEKSRLWKLMVELWPDYERYQRNTDREIAVVVLERRSPS